MSHVLAAAHHASAFNGLFYATTATVIPVLFLALAVQGTLVQQLISAAMRLGEDIGDGADQRADVRTTGRMFKAAIPVWVAALIVFYAVISEYFALWALYNQPAGTSSVQLPVMLGTIFLLGAVALQPASQLGTWLRTEIREGRELRGRQATMRAQESEARAADPEEAGRGPSERTGEAQPGPDEPTPA